MDTAHAPLPLRTDQTGVSTLELFFDLIFVLAVGQTTSLMSHEPTWTGLGRGLVVLGLLWWAWVGYSWLTSVVNPEHVSVRLPILGAMAGFAIASMCVPGTFHGLGHIFVPAFGVVCGAQVALMWAAGHDNAPLRRSTAVLGVSTLLCLGLLVAGLTVWHHHQLLVWSLALLVDVAGPFLFGSAGWTLTPAHFAERHSLVLIIALGESIIAIGVGAAHPEQAGVVVGVILGTLIACCLWWVYFDVLAIVAERALHAAEEGREQNELARDAYSYLHFPMVAGIVLVALGLKKSLAHVHEPLTAVGATALLGGVALYFLGLAAFGVRSTRRVSWDSVVFAAVMLALVPVARRIDALHTIELTTLLAALIVTYKAIHYGEGRLRVRRRAKMLSEFEE